MGFNGETTKMKIDGVEELLQQNREEITSEVHSAVDASQEEILKHLEYLLEQSTDHRQGVERDLKVSTKATAAVFDALQEVYTATNADFHTIHNNLTDLRSTINVMAIILAGAIVLNFGLLTAIIYSVL